MSTQTATGTELPPWELPVTPTLVVSTALATRDFQDVHHDRDLAQGHGSQDIFLNILTTTGLVQRYVGEWARDALGDGFVIRSCGLRLGAPAYPYDTVRFTRDRHRRGRRRTHPGRGRRGRHRRAHQRDAPRRREGRGRPMSDLLSGKAAIAGHRRDGVLQGVGPLRAAALLRGDPGGAR